MRIHALAKASVRRAAPARSLAVIGASLDILLFSEVCLPVGLFVLLPSVSAVTGAGELGGVYNEGALLDANIIRVWENMLIAEMSCSILLMLL